MRSVAIASALGVVLTAGAGVWGCYGATEVRLVVTTTAPCSAGIATQIFTGVKGEGDFGTPLAASAAETSECGPAEPRIGTLTIVPSDARDGRFDLEVVAGVGVQPTTCRTPIGAPKCIFVRRRVSFRPHRAVDLPILLSDRCIGVPCGADETCDLGTCEKITECSASGCPRERGDVDAGPPVDAGTDAVADAQSDAPVATPCGITPEVVVDGQSIVGQLAAQGDDFVYVNTALTQVPEIRRVVRSGGPARKVQAVPGLTTLTAGVHGVAWAASNGIGLDLFREDQSKGMGVFVPKQPTGPIAFVGNLVVGFGFSSATNIGAFAVSGSNFSLSAQNHIGPVSEIVVDDEGDWMAVIGGELVHYRLNAADPQLVNQLQGKMASPDIALVDRTVYVALSAGPGGAGIYGIPRGQIDPTYNGTPIVSLLPDSIAADGGSVYYIVNTKLSRFGIGASGTAPTVITAVAAGSNRLFDDGACIYWIENNTRIMRRAK